MRGINQLLKIRNHPSFEAHASPSPKVERGKALFRFAFYYFTVFIFLSFILFLPFLIEPVDFGVNTLEIVTAVNRLTMTLDSVAPP